MLLARLENIRKLLCWSKKNKKKRKKKKLSETASTFFLKWRQLTLKYDIIFKRLNLFSSFLGAAAVL